MKKGIVTFYQARKGYGFVRLDCGEDVFFHYNDGRDWRVVESELRDDLLPKREPRVNDELIILATKPERKGPKATAWIFADTYFSIKQIIRTLMVSAEDAEIYPFLPELLWEIFEQNRCSTIQKFSLREEQMSALTLNSIGAKNFITGVNVLFAIVFGSGKYEVLPFEVIHPQYGQLVKSDTIGVQIKRLSEQPHLLVRVDRSRYVTRRGCEIDFDSSGEMGEVIIYRWPDSIES